MGSDVDDRWPLTSKCPAPSLTIIAVNRSSFRPLTHWIWKSETGATARSGRTSEPALAVGWLPTLGSSVPMPRMAARPTRVARDVRFTRNRLDVGPPGHGTRVSWGDHAIHAAPG